MFPYLLNYCRLKMHDKYNGHEFITNASPPWYSMSVPDRSSTVYVRDTTVDARSSNPQVGEIGNLSCRSHCLFKHCTGDVFIRCHRPCLRSSVLPLCTLTISTHKCSNIRVLDFTALVRTISQNVHTTFVFAFHSALLLCVSVVSVGNIRKQ